MINIMEINYKSLKKKHRKIRDNLSLDTQLRIHRSLSWLKAAESNDNPDEKFIFLWISFNAIYGEENGERYSFNEKDMFKKFIGRLIRLDEDNLIHTLAWSNYANKIRLFVENKYAFQPYWSYVNGRLTDAEWKRKFNNSRKTAYSALGKKDSTVFCNILFERLYVIRNQLIHGGATWKGALNRSQVTSGKRILEKFIPVIIHLVIENAEENWGSTYYKPTEND